MCLTAQLWYEKSSINKSIFIEWTLVNPPECPPPSPMKGNTTNPVLNHALFQRKTTYSRSAHISRTTYVFWPKQYQLICKRLSAVDVHTKRRFSMCQAHSHDVHWTSHQPIHWKRAGLWTPVIITCYTRAYAHMIYENRLCTFTEKKKAAACHLWVSGAAALTRRAAPRRCALIDKLMHARKMITFSRSRNCFSSIRLQFDELTT